MSPTPFIYHLLSCELRLSQMSPTILKPGEICDVIKVIVSFTCSPAAIASGGESESGLFVLIERPLEAEMTYFAFNIHNPQRMTLRNCCDPENVV